MSTTIKELKNLTDLMTDADLKLLVCDIGFENIEHEFFQIEIYGVPEKYHSVQFHMNMSGDLYFRSESGGIHIKDIPIKNIKMSIWSLRKLKEYFNQNNMVLPAPENNETVGTDCLDYSLYYFINKILPLLHSSME